MTKSYNPLTIDEVVRVAEGVINRKGTATHLDFKSSLRAEGFWATQYEVAQLMYLALYTGMFPYEWTFNGTYRTYYLYSNDALDVYDNDASHEIKQTSWLGWLDEVDDAPAAVTPDPVIIPTSYPKATNNPVSGDWEVFTYDDSLSPIHVTGITHPDWNSARNIARNFYSDNLGAHYAITGAHIVK